MLKAKPQTRLTGAFARRSTYAAEVQKKIGSGSLQNQPILRASFAQTSVKTDSDQTNRTISGHYANKKSFASGAVSEHYLKAQGAHPAKATYFADKVSKTASRRQSTSLSKPAPKSSSGLPTAVMGTFKLSERPVVQAQMKTGSENLFKKKKNTLGYLASPTNATLSFPSSTTSKIRSNLRLQQVPRTAAVGVAKGITS